MSAIPAPMTGQLPPEEPLFARGRAYCSTDFPGRAAAWFAAAWKQREEAAVESRTRARKTVEVPTRIQPARAAKTKRKREEEAAQKTRHPVKRSRTARTAKTAKSTQGYALVWSGCWDGDSEQPTDIFQRMLADVLVEAKTASGPRRRGHDGSQRQPSHKPYACSLAALPLSCTQMAFCLHGTTAGGRGPQAPEAPMESCLSPVADKVQIHVGQGREEGQHVDRPTVDVCGLRFVVDTCNGGTRVVMM